MPSNNRPPDERALRSVLVRMLGECQPLIDQWCAQAGLERWGISTGQFSSELARCAQSKFRGRAPSPEDLVAHVSTLHLEDLALACACVEGVPEAWECFVATYRGYLRACAGAMLKRTSGSPEAQELADSLFAELYGLRDGAGVEKRGSLLRYFHGRSTLKTWLRAVLAQRHIDKIRAGRKFEELSDEDGHDGAALTGGWSRIRHSALGRLLPIRIARAICPVYPCAANGTKEPGPAGRRTIADVLRGRENWRRSARAGRA